MVTRITWLTVAAAVALTMAWFLWPTDDDPSPSANSGNDPSSRPEPRDGSRKPAPAPDQDPSEGNDPCAHPYFPCRAGTRWVYELRENGHPAGTMHVDLRRVVSEAGTVHLHWSIAIAQEGGAFAEVKTLCRPGRWCEDPWFRLSNVGGTREEGRPWEWPVKLTVGRDFDGAIRTALPIGPGEPVWAQLERRHVVEAVEEVTVGAGRFQALRVAVEETQKVGDMDEEIHTQLWVAEGTGLVRALRVERGGVEREYVLAAVEGGS
jgi:hypothetical protein